MLTFRQRWTLASTGAGVAVNAHAMGVSGRVIYSALTGASSGAVSIETAGSSAGPFALIPGTSTTVSTSGANTIPFDGPALWIRPYSSNVTGSIRVEVLIND
jgi:hypothetical protein